MVLLLEKNSEFIRQTTHSIVIIAGLKYVDIQTSAITTSFTTAKDNSESQQDPCGYWDQNHQNFHGC